MLEDLRLRLRNLTQFVDKAERKIAYTDFKDTMGSVAQDAPVPVFGQSDSLWAYRQRVQQFIKEHRHHTAIDKLHRNLPLTERDLADLEELLFTADAAQDRQKFEENLAKGQSLTAFIRSLVGLDEEAAQLAFGRFLQGTTYTAPQIRFVQHVIKELTCTGVMNPGRLYEPPFSDMAVDGVEGLFENDDVDRIIGIVRAVNRNAGVDFDARG